jgi:hypothetical protein
MRDMIWTVACRRSDSRRPGWASAERDGLSILRCAGYNLQVERGNISTMFMNQVKLAVSRFPDVIKCRIHYNRRHRRTYANPKQTSCGSDNGSG